MFAPQHPVIREGFGGLRYLISLLIRAAVIGRSGELFVMLFQIGKKFTICPEHMSGNNVMGKKLEQFA